MYKNNRKLDYEVIFIENLIVYYEDQSDWDMDDFYYLNRFINRMINYRIKRMAEIESLDLTRMTYITKAILKANIMARPKFREELMNLENLKGLQDVKPLEIPLALQSEPTHSVEAYEEMNIWW